MSRSNITKTRIRQKDTKTINNFEVITSNLNPSLEVKYRCMFCTLRIRDSILGCPIDIKKSIEKPELPSAVKNFDQKLLPEFVTYGIFCRPGCIKAFIQKNSHDPQFKNSLRYLSMMVSFLSFGNFNTIIDIKPSNNPELMKEYGGVMTREQYINSLDDVLFIDKGIIIMFPVSKIYSKIEELN